MASWSVQRGRPWRGGLLGLVAGCAAPPSSPVDPCLQTDGDVVSGVDFINLSGPGTLLVGETREFALLCYFEKGPERFAFDVPATITDTNGTVSIQRNGASVVVQGLSAGTAHLTLLAHPSFDAPWLQGSTEFPVATIDHVMFVPGDTYAASDPVESIPPGLDVAFAREASVDVGVGLVTPAGAVLTDRSAHVQLPVGAQPIAGWGFNDSAMAEGAYTIVVTAGTATVAAPFVIADRADTMTAITQDFSIPSTGLSACFAAVSANRYVESLNWSFTLDGQPAAGAASPHNCVQVLPQNDLDHDGVVTIAASAGGASAQFAAPVL